MIQTLTHAAVPLSSAEGFSIFQLFVLASKAETSPSWFIFSPLSATNPQYTTYPAPNGQIID